MIVTFYIGPASAKYDAVSFKVYDVGVEPRVELASETPAGTDEEVSVSLPEGKSCQAVITKTVDGLVGQTEVLNFSTQGSQLSFRSGELKILAVEDESSSSSASSSSTSSASSSSLSSTSSASSSSTSSPSSSSSTSTSSLSSVSSASSSSTSSASSSSST